MKHWFMRSAGAILSIFPFINRADAYSAGSTDYSATVHTVNRWYVGWENPNTAGVNPDSFKNSVFMGEHWEEDTPSVRQPLVRNASGHVVISNSTFYLVHPGADNKYRADRLGGNNEHFQYLLTTNVSTNGNGVKLIYAPTTGFFKAAGCCYLNVCYGYGYTGANGSCRSFSYSGNGENRATCPCFYLPGNISYSGKGSANCRGAYYTGHMVEGPYAYTGAVLASGGSYFTNDNNVAMGCPPIVNDVLVCYKHTSCASGEYHSYSFTSGSYYSNATGCHAYANLLAGMANVKTDVSAATGTDGTASLGLLPMDCRAGQMQGWCTPSYGKLAYMTKWSDNSDPHLCQECPVPSSSSVGGLPLNNKNAGATGYVVGLSACYVSKPTATDDTGTFEFTTSAGSAQTCYYKN